MNPTGGVELRRREKTAFQHGASAAFARRTMSLLPEKKRIPLVFLALFRNFAAHFELTDNYHEATTGIFGRAEGLRPLLPGSPLRPFGGTARSHRQTLDEQGDGELHPQTVGRLLGMGPRDAPVYVHGGRGDTVFIKTLLQPLPQKAGRTTSRNSSL